MVVSTFDKVMWHWCPPKTKVTSEIWLYHTSDLFLIPRYVTQNFLRTCHFYLVVHCPVEGLNLEHLQAAMAAQSDARSSERTLDFIFSFHLSWHSGHCHSSKGSAPQTQKRVLAQWHPQHSLAKVRESWAQRVKPHICQLIKESWTKYHKIVTFNHFGTKSISKKTNSIYKVCNLFCFNIERSCYSYSTDPHC